VKRYDRAAAAAVAVLAVALIPVLYGPALHAMYRLDDYAWLSLPNLLAHGRGLLWVLFSPQAQGTIRPLGDRLWFLSASLLFGLNPLPLHALALCIQALNVALIVDVGRRLLGSPLAGAVAAALWAINSTLVDPLVWASAFNEVIFTCFFLAAFDAFLRWVDSGKRIWLFAHVAALMLALGTVELAVTFPAIVAAYLLLFQRRAWKALWPSLAVVCGYVAAHVWAAPLPRGGPYALTFGWGLAGTLAHYWAMVLGPQEYYRMRGGSLTLARFGTFFLSAAILLWVAARARRSDWFPAFGILWFVLALAPALPLLGHVGFYYTFLPSIGLAWLAGGAVVRASAWPSRTLAVACVAIYAICEIPTTIAGRDWDLDRSQDVARREARLAAQVREIQQRQPSGAVFLSGLDMEQFWWGLCYGELYRQGFTDLHVLPDAGDPGIPIPPKEWCYREDFQYSRDETRRILAAEGRVYDVRQSPPKLLVLDREF
jgi:hypothetical protein